MTGTIREGEGMSKKPKKASQTESFDPFVKHHRSMLESVAWRSLTPRARLLLDRLELEHMRQPRNCNGRLSVSYAEFRAYRVGGFEVIASAVADAEHCGFLEVKRGKVVGNMPRRSSYRLTYLPTSLAPATDEWRRFENRS